MTDTDTPVLPAEARPYVAAVRALLSSLPADERDELIDDLSAHLAELAAEPGPPFAERLGTPSSYAAEFVASAGVATSTPDGARSNRVRELVTMSPALRARLEELRPAWWALRPFVVAVAVAEVLNEGFLNREAGAFELLVVGLVATAAIGTSTRIGRERARWDRVFTVAGVIGLLVVFNALNQGPSYVYVDSAGYQPPGVMTRGDGSVVTNIWAYDRNGNPIDVFLFDQNGRPIDDVGTDGHDERTGEQLHSSVRTDADGRPIPNLYPREQTRVRYGENGFPIERRDRPPVFVTPRLDGESTTTSSPSTTPTSTTTVAPPG